MSGLFVGIAILFQSVPVGFAVIIGPILALFAVLLAVCKPQDLRGGNWYASLPYVGLVFPWGIATFALLLLFHQVLFAWMMIGVWLLCQTLLFRFIGHVPVTHVAA